MTYDEMIAVVQPRKKEKRLSSGEKTRRVSGRIIHTLEALISFAMTTGSKKRVLHQYNYMTDNGEVYRSGRLFESKEAAQKAIPYKILGPALETRLEI